MDEINSLNLGESEQHIKEEIKAESPTSDYDEPSCLLGFYQNKASMDDGSSCYLNCVHFQQENLKKEDVEDN